VKSVEGNEALCRNDGIGGLDSVPSSWEWRIGCEWSGEGFVSACLDIGILFMEYIYLFFLLDADLFFKDDADGAEAGHDDIIYILVFNVIKVLAVIFDRKMTSVGTEESPGGCGDNRLCLVAKNGGIEMNEDVFAAGIKRILMVLIDKGQAAIKGAKDAIRDVKIAVLDIHLIFLIDFFIFFELLERDVFTKGVIILGDFRIVILDNTIGNILEGATNGMILECMATPKTCSGDTFWNFLVVQVMYHGNNACMVLLGFIQIRKRVLFLHILGRKICDTSSLMLHTSRDICTGNRFPMNTTFFYRRKRRNKIDGIDGINRIDGTGGSDVTRRIRGDHGIGDKKTILGINFNRINISKYKIILFRSRLGHHDDVFFFNSFSSM